MPEIMNRLIMKERRRELRKNQTDSERVMWRYLRNRQVKNLKFQRQHGVGPYILDFYCPEVRLAIEVDGSQHLEENQKIYDQERTNFLNSLNIRVLRFWSNEVLRNPRAVVEAITEATD